MTKPVRQSIIGISISLGVCLVLALVSMFFSGDVQTGLMFASYAAGYVAVIWALYTGYKYYVGPKSKQD